MMDTSPVLWEWDIPLPFAELGGPNLFDEDEEEDVDDLREL